MDIEGFEYEVIKSIFNSQIDIDQICVEFHHFYKNINKSETINAINSLKDSEYDLIFKTRLDYTFLKNGIYKK